mmetsp:Transcript_26861/g.74030  ORF Transcript_26861/g.74030 Transcript_26861/m.74030 type:complete len:170 (-) Transcript_26861:43-552(-)
MFPDMLQSLGRLAFQDCPLREILIPQGCATIGAGVFSRCGDLGKIEFESIAAIRAMMLADDFYVPFWQGCSSLHTFLWPQTEVHMSLWPRLIILFFGVNGTVGRIFDHERPAKIGLSGVFASLCHHQDKLMERQNHEPRPEIRDSKRRRKQVDRLARRRRGGISPAPPA